MRDHLCPCCAWTNIVPDETGDAFVACPECGQMLLAPAPWSAATIPNCETKAFIAWPGEDAPEPPGKALVPWELTCQVGKVSQRTPENLILQGVAGILFGVLFFALPLMNRGQAGNTVMGGLAPVAGLLAAGGGMVVLRSGIRKCRRRTKARVARLTESLPVEASQFGAPVALHQVRMFWRLVYVCSGLLVCCGAGVCLAMLLAGQLHDHRISVIAFVGWPVGLYMIWQAMALQAKRTLVFSNGLVTFDHGKVLACRWDQIEELRMTINEAGDVSQRFRLTLRRQDGEEMQFTPNAEYFENQLVARIQYEHAARMLPAMQATLNAGGTLDFGPLQVGPSGIDFGQDFVDWEQILAAGVHKSKVQIFGNGRSWEFDVAKVPNVTLLLAILRRQGRASVAQVG